MKLFFFFLKKFKKKNSIVSCSTRDPSPRDFSIMTLLTGFRWDESRYPINQSLKNLTDIISKKVGQIEAGNKVESQAYNSHRTNLQILEKKQAGSLITRDLGDLTKEEHFK